MDQNLFNNYNEWGSCPVCQYLNFTSHFNSRSDYPGLPWRQKWRMSDWAIRSQLHRRQEKGKAALCASLHHLVRLMSRWRGRVTVMTRDWEYTHAQCSYDTNDTNENLSPHDCSPFIDGLMIYIFKMINQNHFYMTWCHKTLLFLNVGVLTPPIPPSQTALQN